jgi:hypothetical protein
MGKKVFVALAIIVLLVGILTSLYADYKCSSAFTKCTEGACGSSLITAEHCTLLCTGGIDTACDSAASQQ